MRNYRFRKSDDMWKRIAKLTNREIWFQSIKWNNNAIFTYVRHWKGSWLITVRNLFLGASIHLHSSQWNTVPGNNVSTTIICPINVHSSVTQHGRNKSAFWETDWAAAAQNLLATPSTTEMATPIRDNCRVARAASRREKRAISPLIHQ